MIILRWFTPQFGESDNKVDFRGNATSRGETLILRDWKCRASGAVWDRNFKPKKLWLDSRKSGIVAHDCCPGLSPPQSSFHPIPPRVSLWKYRDSENGNNTLLLHFVVQSVLQIDVEVEEPDTSENLTQSFEIQNIIRRRTQLLPAIIYIILNRYRYIIWFYLDIELRESRQRVMEISI